MNNNPPHGKPNINIEGDVKESNIIVGDGNIITVIRNYLFRDTRQLVIVIFVFLLLSGGIVVGYWYSKQPATMTGNFNIAIAQFGEIQEDGSIKSSVNAEKISSTLFGFLDSEYRASGLGLNLQVSHKNMPLVTEDMEAEILAEKVNADIVIYGNIFIQGDKAEFSPRFYVAEHPDTNELTGQNELAYPIVFNISELSTQDQVNTELRKRAEILFNFTKGLIYFSQKDFESALRAVQSAITTAEESKQIIVGQEVLYLLAARIQTNNNNYDNANQMLDTALALNPQYARAHLIRGNIYYRQALETNYDLKLLNDALAEYKLAYQLPNQPEGAYIPVKARTNIGNVLVVEAQQTNDSKLYDQAIENYYYVIKEYQHSHFLLIRPYVAISYFGLGAAYERQGKTEQALDAYQSAYDLTDDLDFKSRIEQQIKILKDQ